MGDISPVRPSFLCQAVAEPRLQASFPHSEFQHLPQVNALAPGTQQFVPLSESSPKASGGNLIPATDSGSCIWLSGLWHLWGQDLRAQRYLSNWDIFLGPSDLFPPFQPGAKPSRV